MRALRLILAFISSLIAFLLIAPVAVVGLPFWVVAFLTRLASNFFLPMFASFGEALEFHPDLGWKPKSNLDSGYFIEGDDIFHIKTDFEGWPGSSSLSKSEMVVFGDSFAFGYGVDSGASYSELSSHPLIKPIGAPGYNMVQELLLIRSYSQRLKGKFVVWFICLDNDLIDNLTPNKPKYYRTPFVHNANGEDFWSIETSHLSPENWSCSSSARNYYEIFAKMCGPNPLSARAYSACSFLINAGRAVCAEAGAKLVVITIPNKNQLSPGGVRFLASHLSDKNGFDPDFPDRKLDLICRDCGVEFIPLKKHLSVKHYKARDVHWNERGHRLVSEILHDLYRDFVDEKAGKGW